MADEHPGKEGEKGKEEKKESPILNAFTLWMIISLVGSILMLGYNYYYNVSTGQPITLGNMMFPKYMSDALRSLASTAKDLPKAIMGEKQEQTGEGQDKEKLPFLADYGKGKTGKFGEAGVAIVLAIAMVFGGWGALRALKGVEKPLRPANFQDLIRKKEECIQEIKEITIADYKTDIRLGKLIQHLGNITPELYTAKVQPFLEGGNTEFTDTLARETDAVKELLSLEKKLEKALKKLYGVEKDTLQLKKEIEKIKRLSAFESQIISLHNAIRDVIHTLDDYFSLAHEETITEQRLQHITEAKRAKDRVKTYWDQKSQFDRLRAVFAKNIAQYEKLKNGLEIQKRAMETLIPLFKEIERQNAAQQTPPATTPPPAAPPTTTPVVAPATTASASPPPAKSTS